MGNTIDHATVTVLMEGCLNLTSANWHMSRVLTVNTWASCGSAIIFIDLVLLLHSSRLLSQTKTLWLVVGAAFGQSSLVSI